MCYVMIYYVTHGANKINLKTVFGYILVTFGDHFGDILQKMTHLHVFSMKIEYERNKKPP